MPFPYSWRWNCSNKLKYFIEKNDPKFATIPYVEAVSLIQKAGLRVKVYPLPRDRQQKRRIVVLSKEYTRRNGYYADLYSSRKDNNIIIYYFDAPIIFEDRIVYDRPTVIPEDQGNQDFCIKFNKELTEILGFKEVVVKTPEPIIHLPSAPWLGGRGHLVFESELVQIPAYVNQLLNVVQNK